MLAAAGRGIGVLLHLAKAFGFHLVSALSFACGGLSNFARIGIFGKLQFAGKQDLNCADVFESTDDTRQFPIRQLDFFGDVVGNFLGLDWAILAGDNGGHALDLFRVKFPSPFWNFRAPRSRSRKKSAASAFSPSRPARPISR